MSHKQTRKMSRSSKVTAPSATSYRGPVVSTLANQSIRPIEVVISQGHVIEATDPTGSASADFYFTAPPGELGVQNSPQWVNYSALYEEFRVLGLEVMVSPFITGTTSPGDSGCVVLAGFRSVEDLVSGANLTTILERDGAKFCNRHQPTRMSIKMNGADESEWLSTADVSANDQKGTGISLYAQGQPNLSLFVRLSWRVQFRSTKPVSSTFRRGVTVLPWATVPEDKATPPAEHPLLLTKEQKELLQAALKI